MLTHPRNAAARRASRGVRVFASILLLAIPHASCASHTSTPASRGVATTSVAASQPAWNYISATEVDVVTLIPQPADEISPQARAFEAQLVAQMKANAGPVLAARAEADENDSLWQFAQVMGPDFTPQRCPRIDGLFRCATVDADRIKNAVKDRDHRRRPPSASESDATYAGALTQPSRSEDWSYPSGHAMRAALRASLLAAIAPDKEEALLKEAWFMCLSRMVRGVHFPSDITAGFVLGEAIAAVLLETEAIQRDLREAREEWATIALRVNAAAGEQWIADIQRQHEAALFLNNCPETSCAQLGDAILGRHRECANQTSIGLRCADDIVRNHCFSPCSK